MSDVLYGVTSEGIPAPIPLNADGTAVQTGAELTISPTNLATHAKQDEQTTALGLLATEATLGDVLTALGLVATEATLGDVLTALGLVATAAKQDEQTAILTDMLTALVTIVTNTA